MTKKTFFIDVKGGLGYNIALVRVIQALSKSDYKVKVMSPYWDIFASAGIDYYKPEEAKDFIFDAFEEGAEIIEHRLYDMSDFIYKKLNYRDAWCKLLGVPEVSEEDYNKLTLNPEKAFPFLSNLAEDVLSKINDKFILVQVAGGQSPLVQVPTNEKGEQDWSKVPYDYEHEPLKRHYPIDKAQKFVDKFKESNPDVTVIQYALPNEPQIEGCEHFVVPYLVYYILSKSDRCLGAFTIDSSLAHLITGNTKVMTVWGHSTPEAFGYSCNKNVIQRCRRNDILYFSLLGPSGAKIDYIEPDVAVKEFTEYIKSEEKSDAEN